MVKMTVIFCNKLFILIQTLIKKYFLYSHFYKFIKIIILPTKIGKGESKYYNRFSGMFKIIA